ncbi:response regulator [bacterium]|nr:response regulator [candidate division CSSED10-310 bacterium]
MTQSWIPEKTTRILVIDDDLSVRTSLRAFLEDYGYTVHDASDGLLGLKEWRAWQPDLVIVDLRMPIMDGFNVLHTIQTQQPDLPVLVVSGTGMVEDAVQALRSGAWDFLMKPIENMEVLIHAVSKALERARFLAFQNAYHKRLESDIEAKTLDLRQALDTISQLSLEVIFRLAKASEFKDENTGNHLKRMSLYAQAIARRMGLDSSFCETILYTAPMHDLGKIGIPDDILLKPGPLTPEERLCMQTHTLIGAQILEHSNIDILDRARLIALYHHERWDSAGYPEGLGHTEIPLEARIVSVADVFDALASRRPYKPALPIDLCYRIIMSGTENAFDPDVVQGFDTAYGEIKEIYCTYRD